MTSHIICFDKDLETDVSVVYTYVDVDIADFHSALYAPVFDKATRQEMVSDFTQEEIRTAILSFPRGKASGPDRFGIEFYEAHVDIIAPFYSRW